MTIAELVDEQVMEHLSLYGCIKNADPVVQHLVKTSEEPLLRFRRWWMRREALRQCLEATQHQEKLNGHLAKVPNGKTAMKQIAVLDPWLKEDMARRHNASWNDRDFTGYVKREEPNIFPRGC